MNKYFANKGVKRNKKPLQNIVIKLEKNIKTGYYSLLWRVQKIDTFNYHGMVDELYIKELLGIKQYSKFKQGKTEFIIQRRINKKNI